MRAPQKNWSLKKIIKKAADVNLNTAIALSKSIIDEEKAKKRRAKKVDIIPLHLMKTPKEVQDILHIRFVNVILQPFILKITNQDPPNKNKTWNKTSLYCDIKPGDLSYDNINISELKEYYVPALMPPICFSEVRVGDKVLSMSMIPGREKSFLFTKDKNESPTKTSHVTDTIFDCNNSFRSIDFNNSIEEYCNTNVTDNINIHLSESKSDKEKPVIISIPSSTDVNTNHDDIKSQNGLEIHRFMKMFNNCKYSDLYVLLKSGNILFLHKFILASWLCDEEILSEPQHCILDIDDKIVLDFFKHLYSDGKYNIDHIIDSADCLNICKMFGLDQSSLVRSRNINISEHYDKNIEKLDSFKNLDNNNDKYISSDFNKSKSPVHFSNEDLSDNLFFTESENIVNENEKFLQKSIIPNSISDHNILRFDPFSNYQTQSTPICYEIGPEFKIQNPTNKEISKISDEDLFELKVHTPNIDEVSKISDGDLFGSVTEISLSVDVDSGNNKSEENKFEIYKKLCIFTNEGSLNNSVDDSQSLSNEGFLDSNILNSEPMLNIDMAVADNQNLSAPCSTYIEVKESEDAFISSSLNSVNEVIQSDLCHFQENSKVNNFNLDNHNFHSEQELSFHDFNDSIGSVMLIENNPINEEISNLIEVQSKSVSSSETLINRNINEIENTRRENSLNVNLLENDRNESSEEISIVNVEKSPLPLALRLKLNSIKINKKMCITISSDEELVKPIISLSNVLNTKKAESSHVEKPPLKRKSKKSVENDTEKVPKLKVARKRKSTDSKLAMPVGKLEMIYETPVKQKPDPCSHFTPMPDYRNMPPQVLQKQCALYGIKQKLSKNKSIKLLEEIFRHTHQVDNGELDESSSSSDSSNCSTARSLDTLSNDQEEDTKSEDLSDNFEFCTYLKTFYFRDILMYKPIDIKQLVLELKENGVNTSLKALNDYFDSQCILVCNNDDKKYNRPLKASKMVL